MVAGAKPNYAVLVVTRSIFTVSRALLLFSVASAGAWATFTACRHAVSADAGSDGAPPSRDAAPNDGSCFGDQGDLSVCDAILEGGTKRYCLDNTYCVAYEHALRPGVFAGAIQCLREAGAAACDLINDCRYNAMERACALGSDEAISACDQAAASCDEAGGGFSRTECLRLAPGLTDKGRAVFVDCMSRASCSDWLSCL
jgi:hypothetical protein